MALEGPGRRGLADPCKPQPRIVPGGRIAVLMVTWSFYPDAAARVARCCPRLDGEEIPESWQGGASPEKGGLSESRC